MQIRSFFKINLFPAYENKSDMKKLYGLYSMKAIANILLRVIIQVA